MPDAHHQVTTGILLADALGDAKRHYLSGWTETTWWPLLSPTAEIIY
jgi:hypothetical protein